MHIFERLVHMQLWYGTVRVTCIGVSSLVGTRLFSVSNTVLYLLDCLYRCMGHVPYHNGTCTRISEDEPSSSKHKEDVKSKN
jgi:hypothetical protein